MLFPTADYAVFFLCAFAGAWSLRRHLVAHKALLLLASYVFYAFADWRFLPLLFGVSMVAGSIAILLQRTRHGPARAALLAGGLAVLLGALAAVKYLWFAASVAFGVLELVGLHPAAVRLPEVALPVGISFFVFHGISLMVDAYRRKIPVEVHVLDALLYVAFFPQLIAGPILRASTFLPQLLTPPAAEGIDGARALGLIAGGLAKKVLIAQVLATQLVDPVFEAPAGHSGLEVLLAVYAYAAQIYCDFSGYSDLAIGSALLLGYRIPDNFNAPYRASSPQDFWRRWHISLSQWLRDYLFIPLGGSRAGRARTVLALMVTMVLGGLWHGAAWGFVAWGAFHGAGLVAHRLWSQASLRPIVRLRAHPGWRWVAPALTFHFVCLGWVLFRATSVGNAWEVLGALARGGTGEAVSLAVVLGTAIGLFGPLLSPPKRAIVRLRFARLPLVVQGLVFALGLICLEALGPRGVAPFIYFRF